MIGTGVSFAAVLSGIFAFAHVGRRILFGGDLELRYLWIETILTGTAPGGFLMGVGFAGLVALTSRTRSLAELSIIRFALLGAAAGFVFSLIGPSTSPDLLQTVVEGLFFSLAGAGVAAGTLLIARKGAPELARTDDAAALEEPSAGTGLAP